MRRSSDATTLETLAAVNDAATNSVAKTYPAKSTSDFLSTSLHTSSANSATSTEPEANTESIALAEPKTNLEPAVVEALEPEAS